MLHIYSNLYLPICSVIISILLAIMYFPKEKISNTDTDYYSKLLILTLVESIFTFFLTLSVHLFFNDNTTFWFAIANKVLYVIYILWISTLFLYFSNISYKDDESIFKKIKKSTIVLNIILISLIFVSKIELVYDTDNLISNSYGLSSFILYIGCVLYILFMIILFTINNDKIKDKRKYFPLWALIFMMIFTLIIRLLDPFVNMTSNMVSLITLVMFFTIENPDLKMLKELEFAKNREKKANKVKEEFLSSMSHEIRTPLNVIYGNAQLIPMAKTKKEMEELASEMTGSVDNLLNMLNEIIDVSKIQADEIELEEKDYLINDELDKIIKLFDSKMESKGLELVREYDNVPSLIGNIDVLRRVIINILDNAVKYTEKGSITLKSNYNNKILKVVIKDTGVGISKENLDKIFNLFERGRYRDSNINGLGLGLSISKYLIEMIEGEISITSNENIGTEVTITIKQRKCKNSESINS